LDPLTDEYPELSNYLYAFNYPVTNIDVDGLFGGDAVQAAIAAGEVFKGAKNATHFATVVGHVTKAAKTSTRIWGAIKDVGSAPEIVAGAAGVIATAWTGVGAVVGGVAVLHGADGFAAGIRQALTGQETKTFTERGISDGLQVAGVSKNKADLAAAYGDAAISIVLTGGAGAIKNIPTVVKTANAAKGGQTIIGEGMKRVSVEAAKRPGSVILNNMPKFTGTADQVTSQMMTYNRQWILQKMRSGRSILDIGLDATKANPSIFYQMEQNMMKNY